MGGAAGDLLTSTDAVLGDLFGNDQGLFGLEGKRQAKQKARRGVTQEIEKQEKLRSVEAEQLKQKDIKSSKAGAVARRAAARSGVKSGAGDINLGSAGQDFLGL